MNPEITVILVEREQDEYPCTGCVFDIPDEFCSVQDVNKFDCGSKIWKIKLDKD